VAARESVKLLQELNPQVAITGHGSPMEGEELKAGLKKLRDEFNQTAVPEHGKYVDGSNG